MEWLYYETVTKNLQNRGNIVLDEWSNGFTIKNVGNSVLWINNDPLQPTESKGFGGNRAEICKGKYTFYFTAIDNPPVGYVQSDMAILTEKYYLPTDEQKKTRRY